MGLNMKPYNIFITVLLCLFFHIKGGSILSNIQLGSSTVNVQTTYSFTLTLATAISDSSTITFTFPSDITLPTIGAITCSGVAGFKKTPTCAVTTTTTIRVSFSSATIDTQTFPLYVITFSNIKNPGSAMTLQNLQIQTMNGVTVLDSTSTATVSYTPITLASSAGSISTVSTQAGIYTSFSISVRITTAVTSTSKVIITFPKWEQRSLGKSTPGSMVDQIGSSCTLGSDLSGTATCAATVSPAATGTTDTVTVTGLFASSGGLTSGRTIKITITNVRNPPTMKPYSTYSISTTDANSNYIETCSGLSLTMTSPGSLSTDSLVRIINTVQVNGLGTYLFIIKTTNPLPVGGWIRVVLASEVTAVGTPTYSALVPQLATSPTITLSGSTIDIKNVVSVYVSAEEAISFTLTNIRNPSTTKTTSSFSIYTFDESNYGIDSRTTGLTTSTSTGTLTSVVVKPINITGVLSYAKDYNIVFRIANPLDTTAGVVVTFDSSSLGYEVNTRTCLVTSNNIAIKSTYTCKSDQSTGTITIGGILSSAVSQSQLFNLTISNLYIRNPPTSKASPAITVYTTQDGERVDSGTAPQIQHNYTVISSVAITSNSYVTSQEDVIYTFTLTPPGYLLTTSWLVITLPSEVTFYDATKAERNCGRLTLVGFQNSSRLDCTVSGQNITIKKGFEKQVTVDPVTLQINIPGLRNPRSLSSTSGFNISIVDATQNYPTFASLNTATITMATLNVMKNVIIVRSSKVNGQTTNYTITLNVGNIMQNNDYFIINSPDDGPVFSTKSQCIGQGSYFTSRTLTCTYINPYSMRYTITNKSLRFLQTSLLTSLSFLVTEVKNPSSTKPSSSLIVTQFTAAGALVEQMSAGVLVINDEPAQINSTQFSVTLANYQVSVSTSYTFTIDPSNYQQDMIVHIVFPIEVELPSNPNNIVCNAVQGTSFDLACSLNVTNRTLIVRNAFPFPTEPRVISFSVTPITNPSQIIKTSSFGMYTYTYEYFALDARNTSLLLDFACQLPCRSCVITNITGCSSCYNPLTGNASLTNLPFLFDNYCYDTCPLSTYYDMQVYTCPSCYSKRCKTCTGPNTKMCTSCFDEAVLINGNCVLYSNSPYFMPFFIASALWIALVFLIMTSCGERLTWFIPSCIAGISILEWIHMFLEVGIYEYYGFTNNSYITAIGGIVLNCLINIYFLMLYLNTFKNHQSFREHKSNYKNLQIINVIFSSIVTSKLFKFLYSHFNDKESCQLTQIVKDQKLRQLYLTVHYLSIVPTCILFLNACYNLALSAEIQLQFTILMDIERIIISIIMISLMIIEFQPKCQERRQCINKITKTEVRIQYITEKYNELGNTSMLSQYDGENDKFLRLSVMRGLLNNLRNIRPNNLEAKVQELIDREQGNFNEYNHQRRNSDPAPFSKDNKKSHHYQHFKLQNSTLKNDFTTDQGLLENNNFRDLNNSDDEDGQRDIMSFPLTPNRSKKYQLADKTMHQQSNQYDFRKEIQDHTFRQNYQENQQVKVDMIDQEIYMSKDFGMDNQLEKLVREKAEIYRLNEELKEQRLQLERERAEIERLRNEGSKSARGMRNDKDRLEGIEQQDYMSQTTKERQKANRFKQTNLDAVRETDKEDIGGKKSKSRNNSQTKRSRNHTLMSKKDSTQSFNSGLNPRNPHKCHGQSDHTRESVYKLRQKDPAGMSRGSSLVDFNSPSRKALQKTISQKSQVDISNQMSQKDLNNPKSKVVKNVVREMTKKNGTKIYYSDKSESSIEDLMDETPTTYNLANGRLDGKSMGYRFGKNILSKGNSPDKIDIFNEQQRVLHQIGSDSSLTKKQSPRIFKKKFRQDPDSDKDSKVTFTHNNSTSIFYLEGSNAGNEDISFIPPVNQNKKERKLKRDLSKYNNISNLINDPLDSINIGNDTQNRAQSMLEMINNDYTTLNQSRNQQLASQTQNITNLVYSNPTITQSRQTEQSTIKDKALKTQHSGFNQPKSFGKERIKALEVAYLTKLVPNKSPQRGSTNAFVYGSLIIGQQPGGSQRINIPPRIQNHTPDVTSQMTGMQILNPPQINNFQ